MTPQKTYTTKQRIIFIAALVLLTVAIFWFSNSANKNNGIYTDPNNGEQVIENPTTEPELNDSTSLTITGKSELIEQGLSFDAVAALDQLFLSYRKELTLASIVSKSVVQSRENANAGFTYTFEVQFDKKDYFIVEIATSDSTNGVIKLLSKDKKTELKKVVYGENSTVNNPYSEAED